MGVRAQKLSVWEDCKEYSWINDNYIVQTTTDLNDVVYSYSIISLKDDFNLIPRFSPNVSLNKTTFDDISESYQTHQGIGPYRFENGYYSEKHSLLGGTTNYTDIKFSINFNYTEVSLDNLSGFYGELPDRNKFLHTRMNSATYKDYMAVDNEMINECYASEGDGNAIYWENYNELGELTNQ
jgi:hypothetical protein